MTFNVPRVKIIYLMGRMFYSGAPRAREVRAWAEPHS